MENEKTEEINEPENPVMPPEEDNPYIRIENEVNSAKPSSYRWKAPVLLLCTASLLIVGVALLLNDLAVLVSDGKNSEASALTVRVDNGNAVQEEDYAELVKTESDSVDFDDPFVIDSVSLEDGMLNVDSPNGNLDAFVFYQPGGKVFWKPDLSFKGDTDIALSSLSLNNQTDYILCWGNANSEKLKAVICPGGENTEDGDSVLLIDPTMLMTVILRN